MDIDQRAQRMLGGRSSAARIILLGDGSELTDSSTVAHNHDIDMLDQDEEDRDLQSQVTKGTHPTLKGGAGVGDDADDGAQLTSSPNEIGSRGEESARGEREGTPAPISATNENDPEIGNRNGDEVTRKEQGSSPSSTRTEKSEDETHTGGKVTAASDGPVASKSTEASA